MIGISLNLKLNLSLIQEHEVVFIYLCLLLMSHSKVYSFFIYILNILVSVCVCAQSLSRVQLFATPWTVAHQAPLSMEFSRQDYWSGLPLPTPGDPPGSGIRPASLAVAALAGGFFTTPPPGKPHW